MFSFFSPPNPSSCGVSCPRSYRHMPWVLPPSDNGAQSRGQRSCQSPIRIVLCKDLLPGWWIAGLARCSRQALSDQMRQPRSESGSENEGWLVFGEELQPSYDVLESGSETGTENEMVIVLEGSCVLRPPLQDLSEWNGRPLSWWPRLLQ